jgi:hypothetical protein
MNYIQSLQAQVQELENKNKMLKDGLKELQKYVSSSKFSCGDSLDGYVSVKDIDNRIQEILSE